MRTIALAAVLLTCAGPPVTSAETFGAEHSGSYHLGPVDWSESMWANSCGPYPSAIQALEGQYLAGVDTSLNGNGSFCDACALVTTRLGKSVLVRIVTTGQSRSAGDIDLSSEAYQSIHQEDSQGTSTNPRPMTWKLASCPASTGKIVLQYQTGANPYWTSLWVRNVRRPVSKVEVQVSGKNSFASLRREADGTWTASSGFGEGAFTLRLTSVSDEVLTQNFGAFQPGQVAQTEMQFKSEADLLVNQGCDEG